MILIITTIWQTKEDMTFPIIWSVFLILGKARACGQRYIFLHQSQRRISFPCRICSLEFVRPFFEAAKKLNQDFDIMIEAKAKNLAMHRLVEEIAAIRGVKRLTASSVEW